MSMSSVTICGSRLWTCVTASRPSRAVPTTRNSPELSTSCETSWRMNALSSTTRTVVCLEDTAAHLERMDFDAAVGEVQEDAAAVVAADVLAEDRDAGRRQRRARRGD